MTSAIKACAEILAGAIAWNAPSARCNVARCGATGCGDVTMRVGVYAGMLPVRLGIMDITAALVEDYGAPSDPRQAFAVAFDNPSMTLHIVGDDLVRMDTIAQIIIEKYDRISHVTTTHGEVNGMRIGPPTRKVRDDRPRYDLQLAIEMEMART